MEELLAEIARILDNQWKTPDPPIPFPEFGMQPCVNAGAWYAPYLKTPDATCLESCHAVDSIDVTEQCIWDPGNTTLTLSASLLKPHKGCCIYGLALLSEDELTELCDVKAYPLNGHPHVSISISRTSLFCNWDKALGRLLLSRTRFYLPPFFEARKMIQIDICLNRSEKASSPWVIDLSQVHPLFQKQLFFPGYLIPEVEIREGLVPWPILSGSQYRHHFIDLDLSETLFLSAYPENGDPFIIHCHEIIDGQYQYSERIHSYTVVARPKRQNEGSNSPLSGEQSKLRDILQNLQSYRAITKDFEPDAAFFTNYITAIPSRGDLHHLLARLPLAKTLGLSIAAIDLETINGSHPAFKKLMFTDCLTDYAWWLHDPHVPLSLPETPFQAHQAHLIVLTFQCQQCKKDIFHENYLDYVCSYLNQHFWSAYHVMPAHRLKGLINE